VPDDAFAAAHARLGDALPGAGDVRERYRAWLASQEVSPGAVPEAIATLADELQARTRTAFGLPAGERVDFELVSGERWGAFADYRGDLRTRVAINTDLPLYAFRLLEFVAHEAYPGHHTEHVCKEVALVRARGYAEAGVFLYPTPQALVAEGIAQVALRCLLGDDAEYVAAERLRPLGIAYEPETAAAVRAAREALGPVRTNVALLLDEGRASVDEARAYARRWMLEPDAHVDRAVRLLLARSWAPYESCYPEGLRLVRAFVDRERDGFRRLLTEQLTTSDLIG
jgi:hypothetical protein